MSKAPFLIQRRRTHYAFRLYAVREELGALVRKMEVSEEGGGRAGGRAGGRREGRRLKARYAPFSVDRVRVLIAKQRVDASTRSGLGRPTFLVALDRPIPCLTPPPSSSSSPSRSADPGSRRPLVSISPHPHRPSRLRFVAFPVFVPPHRPRPFSCPRAHLRVPFVALPLGPLSRPFCRAVPRLSRALALTYVPSFHACLNLRPSPGTLRFFFDFKSCFNYY